MASRRGFFLIPILFFQVIFAGEARAFDFCDHGPVRNSCAYLDSAQKLRVASCEMEMKTAKCEEWAKKHPDSYGKIRNCESEVSCSMPTKAGEHMLACTQMMSDAWKDTAIGLYNMLFLDHDAHKKIAARQEYFNNCTSAECKREMLGPYVGLFTKEEIEGNPNDGTIDPDDYANQNYLHGYSAAVLYRELMKRLHDRAINKGIDEPFIEPWSGEKAKKYLSMSELTDIALEKMGLQNTACYDRLALTLMRCYAFFAVMDPTLLAGATVKVGSLMIKAEVLTARTVGAAGSASLHLGSLTSLARNGEKAVVTAGIDGFRSAPLEAVADPAAGTLGSTADFAAAKDLRKTSPAAKPVEGFKTADEFVTVNSRKVLTTPEENTNYLRIANKTTAADNKTFVNFTNVKQKSLNSVIGNNAKVDAINNRHFERIQKAIRELSNEKQFSGIKIEATYSDWKGIGFVFDGKLPDAYKARLDEIFKSSNAQLEKELTDLKLLPPGEKVADWYRASGGSTADKANVSERISRELSGGGGRVNMFDDPIIQNNNPAYLAQAESLRKDVQADLKDTGLLSTVEGSEKVPNLKVMEIYRKTDGPQAFHDTVLARTGVDLNPVQVATVRNYLGFVDVYQPNVYSPERVFASLDGSKTGGMTVDKKAMGAVNHDETARALVRADGDPEKTLLETRRGEQRATEKFKAAQRETEAITKKVVERKRGVGEVKVVCSGDDCAAVAASGFDPKTKQDLIKEFSKTNEPAGRRISFVGADVATDADRAALSNHGESVEKKLREYLAGKIPESTLDKVTFGVDMQGQAAGQGNVQLLIGNSQTRLGSEEHRAIQEAFKKAVETVNESASRQLGRPSAYRAR